MSLECRATENIIPVVSVFVLGKGLVTYPMIAKNRDLVDGYLRGIVAPLR